MNALSDSGRRTLKRTASVSSTSALYGVFARDHPESASPSARGFPDERLYHTGNGNYVQYGGRGRLPKELEQYMAEHGDLAPYIPLPTSPTQFRMGEVPWLQRKIEWNGRGKLPPEVLDYVRENGVLPPHY
jgi:hypothetical protein